MTGRRSPSILTACLLVLTGCSTATSARVSPHSHQTAEAICSTLAVTPVVFNMERAHETTLSPAELTQLLIAQLRSQGIPVVSSETTGAEADYTLNCVATRLGYAAARRRYPPHRTYEAELTCAIIDPATQAVRWQRNLTQRYDETVLLNTMTKLPPRHGGTLLRECITPLAEGMAYGVRLFLARPQSAVGLTSARPTQPVLQETAQASGMGTWRK